MSNINQGKKRQYEQPQQWQPQTQPQPQLQPQLQPQQPQQQQLPSHLNTNIFTLELVPYIQVTSRSAKLNPLSKLYNILNDIYLKLPCFINKGCPFGGDTIMGGGFHIEFVKNPMDSNKHNLYNKYNNSQIDLTKKSNWGMCGNAFCYKLGKEGKEEIHITVAFYKGGISFNDLQSFYPIIEQVIGAKLQ